MSRTFEYYGNLVYGDGSAPPCNNVARCVTCCLCGESMQEEAFNVKDSKYEYIDSIKNVVCRDCLNSNPTDLLDNLQKIARIDPQENAGVCLRLNRELINRGLLNFPVFRYMQGLDYGMRYNLPLLKQIIKI
jgi:hypothetical protein